MWRSPATPFVLYRSSGTTDRLHLLTAASGTFQKWRDVQREPVMTTKADVPDHPGLMAHALIERNAELLVTDPDRMAMAHEIGGRDHEREAFRQADRILYLNPRTV